MSNSTGCLKYPFMTATQNGTCLWVLSRESGNWCKWRVYRKYPWVFNTKLGILIPPSPSRKRLGFSVSKEPNQANVIYHCPGEALNAPYATRDYMCLVWPMFQRGPKKRHTKIRSFDNLRTRSLRLHVIFFGHSPEWWYTQALNIYDVSSLSNLLDTSMQLSIHKLKSLASILEFTEWSARSYSVYYLNILEKL